MRAAIWTAMAGIAALAVATAARADVVYDFTTTSYGSDWGVPSMPGVPLSVALTISDAAVQRGSFDLKGSSPGPGLYTGDVANFRGLIVNGEKQTPTHLVGTVAIDLAFNAQGDVTSSSLTYLGVSWEALLTGSNIASGWVGADDGRCNAGAASHHCSVSGVWTDPSGDPATLPEPMSLSVLGIGLLGVAASRCRSWFYAQETGACIR